MKSKPIKEVPRDKESSEEEGDSSDYADMGDYEEDSEMENWEDGEEDWVQEMEKLSKIEQLRAILRRLMEFKKQGGEEGIDQKIGEVQLELRRHLRGETGQEKFYY